MLGTLKSAQKKAVKSVKRSSSKLADVVDKTKQQWHADRKYSTMRNMIENFDWVKYNEDYFYERRSLRDGILALPADAWKKAFTNRRRVLENVESTGSTRYVAFGERTRGNLVGAAGGFLATGLLAGSIGVVAAPAALCAGAVVGALAIGGRSSDNAKAVMHDMKINEFRLAEVFDGIIASLASRYGIYEGEQVQMSLAGEYTNQWGSLGADTVSARFGGLTIWASEGGLRVRLKAGIVTAKKGKNIIQQLQLMPSVVDHVILHELGTIPRRDAEAIIAMTVILASARGQKVASHLSAESKSLMTSVFHNYTITFDLTKHKKKHRYISHDNIFFDREVNAIQIAELGQDGQVYFREPGKEECVMPLLPAFC